MTRLYHPEVVFPAPDFGLAAGRGLQAKPKLAALGSNFAEKGVALGGAAPNAPM